MGTFAYMAPEVVAGQPADERSDIFALGVMVVEALTGRRPFQGRTQQQLFQSLMRDEYHLSGDSPAVYRLDAVLSRCLAKGPGARFASVIEMQSDLVAAIRECPPLGARAVAEDAAETH